MYTIRRVPPRQFLEGWVSGLRPGRFRTGSWTAGFAHLTLLLLVLNTIIGLDCRSPFWIAHLHISLNFSRPILFATNVAESQVR
jgi:hypothetical protein